MEQSESYTKKKMAEIFSKEEPREYQSVEELLRTQSGEGEVI